MNLKFFIGILVLLLCLPLVLGGLFNPTPPPPMIGPTGPQGPQGPAGPPGNYSIGAGLLLVNNGTEIQVNFSMINELYNDTYLILFVNSSLSDRIDSIDNALVNITLNISELYSNVDSLNLSIQDLYDTKLNITDQRYNETYLVILVNQSLQQEIQDRINNDTYLQSQIDLKLNIADQRYNDTILIYAINQSLQQEIQDRINNDTYLQSQIDSLGLEKLNITDQRYNDTGYINSVLGNYYNKTESDGLYYPLTNPAGYINESFANSTYYPQSNPAGYINNTGLNETLNNTYGIFVRVPGDSMTGDLNMTNNSIYGVDILEVHNITGRSPIYVDSPIISRDSINATNIYGSFFGDINGQNGTIFGMTITNGTITNMRVIDSAVFNTSLLPELNNTWSLGEGPDKYWKSFYVGELFAGNISSPDISNLYNITYLLEQNKLNITDQRYNDTYYADEIWIYRITTPTNITDYYTFYFNETRLNITIQSIIQINYYNKTEIDNLLSNISLTPGPPGANGTDGMNGTSVNISLIVDNLDGTYTWYFSDGYNFTTSNLTGPQGIPGQDGVNGTNGINGTSVTISNVIDNFDGTFIWQFSDGYNFTTSNLTGPQGMQGIQGINGTNGVDGLNGTSVNMSSIVNNGDGTYTWYFSDGYNFTTSNLTGMQGVPGVNGTNGMDGLNGTNGINGTSVYFINITNNNNGTYTWYFSDGYNFTTGNLTGPQGVQGIQGVNGTNGINGTSFDVSGPYLYDNGSNVIFFNDSALPYYNITYIEQNYYNTTYIEVNYYNMTYIDELISILNQSIKQPTGPYLSWDNTTFWINETYLNRTINNISKIRKLVYNMSCTTVSGLCSNISSINISYAIIEIKVVPTTLTTNYRFEMTEYPYTTNIIDKNRVAHNGIWDIEKNYAINGQVQANITNANNDELFTISTIYLYNGVE